jgi:membrane associated rhomboid family serine protease
MPAVPVPGSPDPQSPDRARKSRLGDLPFDPTSWAGALITMTALASVLWIVEIVNSAGNYDLAQYGLRPRDVHGLIGVVTMPFLHAGYGHLLANSAPFILIGWVVLLSGVGPFLLSSAIIIVAGGLATWLVAPSVGPHGAVVGASSLIIGWLGYLLGRAYFSRRVKWIIVAVLVLVFFGTLLGGLLPSVGSEVSWQGHLSGFAAGVCAAWLMHPRHNRERGRGRDESTAGPAPAAGALS